jgi:hypothetical protein
MARKWLTRNIENNRTISQHRVQQMGRDMQSDNWVENGETIKFAATGELIDGQKRLTACIEFNVPFWSMVAYGLKRDAFLTIDRNQIRSIGQQLHLTHGVTDYNNLQSALTWLSVFVDGIISAIHPRPTAKELEDILNDNPDMQESVNRAGVIHKMVRTPSRSTLAFCHYCFTRQDATLAEAFFDALSTGANLRTIDPVYRLRERLISSAAVAHKRIPRFEFIALMFKAWQMVKEGKTLEGTLRWQVGESFPSIGPIGTLKRRPGMIAVQSTNVPKKRVGRRGNKYGDGNAETKENREIEKKKLRSKLEAGAN